MHTIRRISKAIESENGLVKSMREDERVSNSNKLNAVESTIHMLHRASQLAEKLFETSSDNNGLTARQFIVLALVEIGRASCRERVYVLV